MNAGRMSIAVLYVALFDVLLVFVVTDMVKLPDFCVETLPGVVAPPQLPAATVPPAPGPTL